MNLTRTRLKLTSALVRPSTALGLVAGLCLGLGAASAEVASVERSGQENVSYESATDSEVDRLIHQFGGGEGTVESGGEKSSEEIAANAATLRLHIIADEINAAYEAKDFEALHLALSENPEVRALRPEVNLLEAWAFHNGGNPGKAHALFMELYRQEPSVDHAAGVIYSGMASSFYTRTVRFAQAEGGVLEEILRPGELAPQGEPQSQSEKTRLLFLQGWLDAAIRYGRLETAEKVARLLGVESIDVESYAEQENDARLAGAWSSLKAGELGRAAQGFTRVLGSGPTEKQRLDALFGYGLVLLEEGEVRAAHGIIESDVHNDPRLLELSRTIALEEAYIAFKAERFQESLLLAQRAKVGKQARGAKMLEGWSHYKLGQFELAATSFVALYKEKPGQESADGVTAALMALGRRDEIVQLAADYGPPLTPPKERAASEDGPWEMSASEGAFHRGDFILASATREDVAQTLATHIGVGLNYRHRDGDRGLGHLDMVGSKVSLDLTDKNIHLRADIEVLHLDSGGRPAFASQTGSRTLGPHPYAPTYEDTVFQPSFLFRKEGIWGIEGSLGTTPLEGEVSPTITGHFDVVHHRDDARYSAGVHRHSIYESVLSISGLVDTVTGQSYGRVIDSGVHASLYQPLIDGFALTAEATYGERTGQDVDGNQHYMLALGAVYSFDATGFRYLAVGPSFRSEAYDENRSFFTHGHGGYYSPADLSNLSLNLNFMTEEKKDWIVRGSFSLGYEEAKTDDAPLYPLAPLAGDPIYLGSQTDGFAFSGEAVAARRFNDRVIGEIGAYAIETEGYSEAGGFIKLRMSFGLRDGVFRTDLTEDLHRKYH